MATATNHVSSTTSLKLPTPMQEVIKGGASDGQAMLAQRLSGKDCLIVLDDVWHANVIQAFHIPGARPPFRGKLLITTRDSNLWAEASIVEIKPQDSAGAFAERLLANLAFKDDKPRPSEVPLNVKVHSRVTCTCKLATYRERL